jgi:UDP-glucose 4-epimerase
LLDGENPVVHGDGLQSRDFTYIDDVVAANLTAASVSAAQCAGQAYNIAEGVPHSLLDLLDALGKILDVQPKPTHSAPRAGDVRMSQADASAATRDLGFACKVGFEDGLRRTVAWFRKRSDGQASDAMCTGTSSS